MSTGAGRQRGQSRLQDQEAGATSGIAPGIEVALLPAIRHAIGVLADMQVHYGETVKLVGSAAELGGWDVGAAPQLTWSDGDWWTTNVELSPGDVHFKVIIMHGDYALPDHCRAVRVLKAEAGNDPPPAPPAAAVQFVRVSDGGEHWEDCHDRSLQVLLSVKAPESFVPSCSPLITALGSPVEVMSVYFDSFT